MKSHDATPHSQQHHNIRVKLEEAARLGKSHREHLWDQGIEHNPKNQIVKAHEEYERTTKK